MIAVDLVDGLQRFLVVGPDSECLTVEVMLLNVVGGLLEMGRSGEV